MTSDPHTMPRPPAGFVACRSFSRNTQTTHLVTLDERGRNGGRPTACGLTRFDDFTPEGRPIPGTAGLPGWGLGDSGVSGPGVAQVPCKDCYSVAGETAGMRQQGEER